MTIKAAIYSSTVIGDKFDTGDVPRYNANKFPCHNDDVEVVYLNGNYPDIEALCRSEGLTVKPLKAFKKPMNSKDN